MAITHDIKVMLSVVSHNIIKVLIMFPKIWRSKLVFQHKYSQDLIFLIFFTFSSRPILQNLLFLLKTVCLPPYNCLITPLFKLDFSLIT